MEKIAKHYDRLIACLPFKTEDLPGTKGKKKQLLEPTTRAVGTLLTTLGAGGFVFVATRTGLRRLQPTLNAVTVLVVASGMVLGFKHGWRFHCDGGNHSIYGDEWKPHLLPSRWGLLLTPYSFSGSGSGSGHGQLGMDRNDTLSLSARTFFSGVGIAALGMSAFDLISAVKAGLKLRGAIAGTGVCVGIGHHWLWQTTNGRLPWRLKNESL